MFSIVKNVPSIQDGIWRVGKRIICSPVSSDPLWGGQGEGYIIETEVFKIGISVRHSSYWGI